MMNMLLIVLPLLIPVIVLGNFFVRVCSRRPDKYKRIYHTFSLSHPSFVPGGYRRFVAPSESVFCDRV